MSPGVRLRQWAALATNGARLGWHLGNAVRTFQTNGLHPPGTPLSAREHRRIRHYHIGATYLATLFCTLRGYPPGPEEKPRLLLMAALSGLFDDTSEDFYTGTPESLEDYAAMADPQGRCLYLLRRLEAGLPAIHREEWERCMIQLFELETRAHSGTSCGEKGALAVLLFRLLLDHPLPETERDAWMAFGRFIQLCDDLFDCWSDRQNGQITLVVRMLDAGDLRTLENHFSVQLTATRNAVLQTPYPPFRRKATLAVLHFLTATARVCLRHYRILGKKHGTLPLDDRTAMVVDMERWTNRRRAAWHLLYEPPW